MTLFVSGLALAARITADPGAHHFSHMDTPDLWTSSPVVIDPSRQHYERIEGAPVIAYLPPTDGDVDMVALAHSEEHGTTATDMQANLTDGDDAGMRKETASSSSVAVTSVDSSHANWCFARYRSYRSEDDTYQPYGGGARQQCVSPSTSASQDVAAAFNADSREPVASISATTPGGAKTALQQTAAMDAASAGSHEEWCHERYRSYRAEDNSYQPLDGGPRKVCASPYG